MTTQITATTELQAINTMLSFIGEAPVSTISSTTGVGSDVAIAKNILDETSMSVQTQGWHFNTENEVTLQRDSNNKVVLPINCVHLEVSPPYQATYAYTMRGGYLYDLKNHTDVFTYNPVVDYVLVQQFEDLPQYARHYISVKSARRFCARYMGSLELNKLALQDEEEAHITFEQADARAGDYNVLTGNYSQYYIVNRTRTQVI